jgi:hypothetical protein
MPQPVPKPPAVRITDCPWGDCPAVYDTDGTDLIVRAYADIDPEHATAVGPLPAGELLGRIPRAVLLEAAHHLEQQGAGS